MATEEFIDIDLDAVDDGSDPIPEKTVLMRVKKAQGKHKTGSDYPYINVIMNPIGGTSEKYYQRQNYLTLSYHPNSLWNMAAFTKAFKIPTSHNGKKGFYVKQDADGNKEYPDFEGKEGWVTMSIEPSQKDPERKVNSISNPYHPAEKKF